MPHVGRMTADERGAYRLGRQLFGHWPFDCVTRPESASPATGSAAAHKLEQERLIAEALG